MAYKMKVNACAGTFQGVHIAKDRTTSESAPWPTKEQAVDAIHHHHRTGKWPREVQEVEVSICEACGRPLPPSIPQPDNS